MTYFFYDWGVRQRLGDTYIRVVEPLTTASLAKRKGALHRPIVKRRCRKEHGANEEGDAQEGALEPTEEHGGSMETNRGVDKGVEQ